MANVSTDLIASPAQTRPNIGDYILAAYQLLTGCLGMVGNTILLLAMQRQQLFKQSGYIIIAHFAIPDFGQSLICLVHSPWTLLRRAYWLDGSPYARAEYILLSTFFVAVVFGLKFLIGFTALSRYCVICHPVVGRTQFDRENTHKWLKVTWLVALVGSGPLYFNFCFDFNVRTWLTCPDTPRWIAQYGFWTNVIPTALMVVLYPVCISRITQNRKKMDHLTQKEKDGHVDMVSKSELRVLRLFVINSLMFTAYWLPYYSAVFFELHFAYAYGPPFMEYMRGILISYNPIMYYMVNSQIRVAIDQLLYNGKSQATTSATAMSQTRSAMRDVSDCRGTGAGPLFHSSPVGHGRGSVVNGGRGMPCAVDKGDSQLAENPFTVTHENGGVKR